MEEACWGHIEACDQAKVWTTVEDFATTADQRSQMTQLQYGQKQIKNPSAGQMQDMFSNFATTIKRTMITLCVVNISAPAKPAVMQWAQASSPVCQRRRA